MENLRINSSLMQRGDGFADDLPPGREPAAGRLDIRSFIGLIRRQAKLILATMFGVCTLTILALFQLTPVYSASALIMVDPRQQSILDPGGQMTLAPTDQGRVESEVEILQSPSLFLTVVRDLQLVNDPEYGPRPGWRDRLASIVGLDSPAPSGEDVLKSTLESLQRATSISRLGITYLIEVTVRSTDPAKAARIANSLAEAYVTEQVDAKVAMATSIQQALFKRRDEASAAVREAEAKVDDFISKNIDSVADDVGRHELADLRNQIATRAADSERLSKLIGAAQSNLATRNWDQLVSEIDSEEFKQLYKRRGDIAQAIDHAGSDEQKAFDLRASLTNLDSQLRAQADNAVAELQQTLDVSRNSEATLRQQLRDRVIRSELPKDTLVKLYEIQQEASVSRSVYEDLLNRSKGIEAQKNVQVPDSRIVSEALPPLHPSFPKKTPILGVAAAFSLMLGLGLAFLRENFIGGFVSEAQTEQVLRLPVVSSRPRVSAAASDGGAHADEIVARPLSPYSEAVRRARIALEMAAQTATSGNRCKLILVTSAMPGEGKTQTAISLARSLAISGHKTLLMDCDFRRPTVHKSLGIDPSRIPPFLGEGPAPGLSEIISKDVSTDLCLLLGQRGGRAATDAIVDSPKFLDLITRIRAEFQYVVMDTSPVLPVVDPRLLLRYADVVVLVVKWALTSQREVMSAINDLERANRSGIPVLAALNNSNVGAAGYGAPKYYEGYYED